jgi:hypothetical protein
MSNEQETFEALREELASRRRALYLCVERYAEALEQIDNLNALVGALTKELRVLKGTP